MLNGVTGAAGPSGLGVRRRLWLLVLGSLALNLVGIGWGLGGAWTWAPDEIRPSQVLSPASWSDKYPPLHRHVLTPVVRPAKAALDAFAELPWQQELALLVLLQRLVSAAAAAGVVLLVARIAGEVLGERAALPAGIVTALSPSFVYYAKTANLEMPYLFWFTLSLLFFVRAWKAGRLRDFLGCSAAAIAAVTTKDQAYGLFPVLMAASLVRIARDHAASPGWGGRVRATLADRRLWGSVLLAAALFGAIYAAAGDFDDLVAHVEKIVGHNTMKYRIFENSAAGFARMWLSAVEQCAFLVSWPLFGLAVVGLALAAWRRDEPLLLVLALVPVGYVLSFVWVVGFHFVRFFLPLLPILALLAARGWLASSERFPRAARALALVVLAFALVRSVRVDAAMLTDTRLEAAAFLEARPAAERAIGIGRVAVLPIGLEAALWGQIRPGDCAFLDRVAPERVVFNATDLRDERERAVVRGFEIGLVNYDLERRFLPRIAPPGWGSSMTNLSFVTPEIRVYRRVERPCLDQRGLTEILQRKESRGNAELERVLIGLLLREGWGTGIDPLGRAALYGTSYGGWTRATQPAILALQNPGPHALSVQLTLAVAAEPEHRPVPVRVEDRGEVLELSFGNQKTRRLDLADLQPGESRLVWFWSKRAWPGREEPPRLLGVKLAGVSLEPIRVQSPLADSAPNRAPAEDASDREPIAGSRR